MFPLKDFEARFREILEALDGEAGDSEALEDLNAEFEDALMMLAETDLNGPDWREELADAFGDFAALAGDYRRAGGVDALAERLARMADMARANLEA